MHNLATKLAGTGMPIRHSDSAAPHASNTRLFQEKPNAQPRMPNSSHQAGPARTSQSKLSTRRLLECRALHARQLPHPRKPHRERP